MGTTQYFVARTAAQRYARGRPSVRPQAVERIRQRLSLPWPVARAIDVACGTGLSTAALKPLAREVVGVDISAEMIRMAPADPQISYVVARAEDLPFPDNHCDLLTLCGALHWVDARPFFAEAHRVLRSGGHLVIYDAAFTGTMENNPAFHSWMRHVFLKMYPMPHPPRLPMPQTGEEAGFRSLGTEEYRHGVALSLGRLVDYMVTRSNVIAMVEGGGQTIEQMRAWLMKQLLPFFEEGEEEDEKIFPFGGAIWYFVKA